MPVYTAMWGPNEFTCTGNLLDWDRTDRLGEIRVPTLITVGEFDEVHPSCARTIQAGIPGSRLEIFPGCGHEVHSKTRAIPGYLDRFPQPRRCRAGHEYSIA